MDSKPFTEPLHPIPKCCESPGCPCCSPGISIRDWFAGMALAGTNANPGDGIAELNTEARAVTAYADADAMLKERET